MNFLNCFKFPLMQCAINDIRIMQVKNRSNLNRPKLRNPTWFMKKERVKHNENITEENQNFIKEKVWDTFGAPVVSRGTFIYPNNVTSLLKSEQMPKEEWKPGMRRTGVIARKIGLYPLWKKDGTKIHTTLLQVIDNHVIKYIPPEQYEPTQKPKVRHLNKFGCLLVGSESIDPTILTKEYVGLFKNSGVMPKKNISRFIISPEAALPPGTPLNASHFRVGDYVDVRGKTVYHGFEGVCYRHGFKGQPASHGQTKTHRRPGNIGGGIKHRVWPGTKLPGHMGHQWRISKGLKIWRINSKMNVLWVTGSSTPGDTNGLVYIFDSILPLRQPKTPLPFPTLDGLTDSELPEDIWSEELHNFKDDQTILFDVEK